MLTYSLVYTPEKIDSGKLVKYTCRDNKIHIRFKDYNSPQEIYGFEAKLTYLITYLMNFYYLPNILEVKNEKVLIEDFLAKDDIKILNAAIDSYTSFFDMKYKGLKLLKNYNKKSKTKYFGDVDLNCFPFNPNKEISYKACLKEFLSNLGEISIINYLFNDNYKIIIHEKKERKTNKFERKQVRLENKNNDSDLIELW